MHVDEIRKLIKLLEESDLHEIEVARWWGLGRVRLTKNTPRPTAGTNGGSSTGRESTVPAHEAPAAALSVAPPAPVPAPAPVLSVSESNLVAIKSPMVGTFYRTPAPDADPYVEAGQVVEVGQTVCIVEAMKLMNEIESDVRGRIVAIKVENKEPVEYGQVLFLVDPAA